MAPEDDRTALWALRYEIRPLAPYGAPGTHPGQPGLM
jgi:hypothetical protein